MVALQQEPHQVTQVFQRGNEALIQVSLLHLCGGHSQGREETLLQHHVEILARHHIHHMRQDVRPQWRGAGKDETIGREASLLFREHFRNINRCLKEEVKGKQRDKSMQQTTKRKQ